MSVHDARVDDIYVDARSKLWRVTATCAEPTVHVVEIEPNSLREIIRKNGGVSGMMWNGFKRIHRPERTECS